MKLKIDKDVPIPTGVTIYPWDEMCIGDSFFLPFDDNNTAHAALQNLEWFNRLNRTSIGVHVGRNVVTNEEGIKGQRIWRIR